MKFSDRLSGLLILIFGVAIVAYARTFPAMPGQSVGPPLFPTVIGGGLALLGATLMFTVARTPGGSWIELDDWVRRPRMVFNFALVIVDLVFYALVVNRLGFFITSFVFLAALFLTFGVARRWIAPLAV